MPSDPTGSPTLESHVAARLRASTQRLVDEWVHELSRTMGVRPSRILPTEAMCDHIPAVLDGVADYLSLPVEVMRNDVVDRLRLLAELRREQGFDIEEILIEFETLSGRLFDWLRETLDAFPGQADAMAVAEISRRLHEALAAMAHVTVTTYRQEESQQRSELSKRLSEYARAVAHELKSPLHTAQASARLLGEGAFEGEQEARLAEMLTRSLERMGDLIDDVRELALEEGARGEVRRISLRAAVESVFEEVNEHAAEKGVSLQVEGELPPIKVDASRVEIALMNFVSNAIKYGDPEKEERWVRVRADPVEGGGHSEGGYVIRVRDNGLGIPRDLQNKVFQRRFRAHPDVADGTGLGLSIARHLVTQRGGTIGFESEEGEGSTFWMTVPERQEEPEKRGGKRQP